MRRPEGPSLEVRRLRDLIRSFFADYLRIVESDAAAELRLDDIALRRKRVDGATVVAEIASRQGEKVTVLVRIEPEGLTPDAISLRLGASVRSSGHAEDPSFQPCPLLLALRERGREVGPQ